MSKRSRTRTMAARSAKEKREIRVAAPKRSSGYEVRWQKKANEERAAIYRCG